MQYTIIVNEYSYELPKKTIAVMEKVDNVLKTDSVAGLSVKQKFERLHNFVKSLVGEETAEKMLGSSSLTEIDLSDLTLIVKKVVDAYEKPITDYDIQKSSSAIDSLPMDKIISMTKAAERMAAMQTKKR